MPSPLNRCSPWIDAGRDGLSGDGKSKTAQEWQKYTSLVASKWQPRFALIGSMAVFFQVSVNFPL
jgi:hypothetical protein